MELKDVREKIDRIDDEIAKLYGERMQCVNQVIEAKKQSGKAVFDPDRERNIILRVTEQVDEDKQVYLKRVFETIMDTSKAYQTVNSVYNTKLSEQLESALLKASMPENDSNIDALLSRIKTLEEKLKNIEEKGVEIKKSSEIQVESVKEELKPIKENIEKVENPIVETIKVEGVEPNMVVEEIMTGYSYKDRILRPSMVKVSE